MSWNEDDEFDKYENDSTEDTSDDCPYCGGTIFDDAVQCPHCGNYISREDSPLNVSPWIAVGVVVCLGIVLWWILGGW